MDQKDIRIGDKVRISDSYRMGICLTMGYRLRACTITVSGVTELGFTIKESHNFWLGTFEHPFDVITKKIGV